MNKWGVSEEILRERNHYISTRLKSWRGFLTDKAIIMIEETSFNSMWEVFGGLTMPEEVNQYAEAYKYTNF